MGEQGRLMDKLVFATAQKWFGDLGPEVVATMYGIAMAESGGNPNAYNPNGLDRSHGFWQINIHPAANPDLAHMDLKDPDQNGRAARIIYDRQGLKAWTTYTGGHYRPYTNEVFGIKGAPKGQQAMPERDEHYQEVSDQINAFLADQRYLRGISQELVKGSITPADAIAQLREAGHAPTPDQLAMFEGTPSASQIISLAMGRNSDRLGELYVEVFANNEFAAADDFGHLLTPKQREDLAPTLYGRQSQQGFAPAPYQFQILPNGDVIALNPNNGGPPQTVGNFPNAIEKTVSQDRNGNLIAFDPYTRTSEILVPDFGFPELDPMLTLRTETLLSAARLEADWAGVELAARGQQLEALAQDNANKILVGQMTYEESRLDLDRWDRALTQRRDERQQVLDYGVTRESLRTLPSGEVVTTTPFAKQTSEILNRFIPGGGLSESDFQLGVSYINPDQAASDLLGGSAYDSPIPGIIAGLQSNKGLTDSILANTPQRSSMSDAAVAGVL